MTRGIGVSLMGGVGSWIGTFARLLVATLLIGGAASPAVAQEPADDAQKAQAEVDRLIQKVGELYQAGKYAEARQVAEEALALAEKALGPDHPNTAASLSWLSGMFHAMGDLPAARPLLERALAINEKALGPDHPNTITSLNNLAALLKAMGDLPAARPLFERALAINEKAFGPDHPGTATALINLGYVLQVMGNLPAARPLLERALSIREKALGADHPDSATALIELGYVLRAMGNLQAARPLLERALSIREKALGANHPDTGAGLNNLANVLKEMGDLPAARPLYERALAIAEKALGRDHADTATGLQCLGSLLQAMGDLSVARPLLERSLAIREKAQGPDHPDTATGLNSLGSLLQAMGDLPAARPLYERALAIREKSLGPDHPNTASSLSDLAGLLQAMGNLPAARPLMERALAINQKALRQDHPDTAGILNNLGYLLQVMGDLSAARAPYERALAIQEKALGPNHQATAMTLINLGALLQAMGDGPAARPLYERALAIREKSLGQDHPDTASSLSALSSVLMAIGDLPAALSLSERALAIREKAQGSSHPDTATSLDNLAVLLQAMGDLQAARPLFERALAIRGEALGPDHPDTAVSANNLSLLRIAMGDLKASRPLIERALAIVEKSLVPDHPTTAILRNNLARLLQAMGDLPAAQPLYEQAWQANCRSMHTLLPVQSSRERCAMLQDRAGQLGYYLSAFSAEPARTYAAVLAWKGAALRATAVSQRLSADASPEDRTLADRLAKARSALAQLILSPPEIKPGEPTIADRYAKLAPEIEKMERDLAALQPDFAARAFLDPTPQDVLAALPAGTALVDVLENEGNLWCWVLLRGKEIRSFDLGKAADVAPLADAFRQALERRSGDSATILAAWRTAGEKLRVVLAAPLATAMDGTQEICFCLDGTLATVPLGLLPWGKDESGLLLESVRVRHQTSGAGVALAAATKRKAGTPTLLVLGGIDYGTPAATRPGGRTRSWSSLPATETEAKGVADRFRRRFADAAVTAVAGKQATEAAVKTLAPAARYIHAATHGFFELETLRKTLAGTRGASAAMQIVPLSTATPAAGGQPSPRPGGGQNPLLLSGLILAGANADPRPGEDDGWLTAEELQGLDLTGTELVVLSACSTGRGELAAGEGVLGLQRSLTVAGARGFLLSLWNVPDADTQELMERFYDSLWAKEDGDPAEALRAAQLALLAEDRKAGKFRPHRWGAWVLVR